MKNHLVAFVLSCLLLTVFGTRFAVAETPKMKVAFLNPDNQENLFWGQLSEYMQVAAAQLNVDLTIYNADADRFKSVKIATELTQAEDKPDYVIMMYQVSVGKRILELMNDSDIPVFIINTDIHPNDKPSVGLPRQTFKNWLGHMSPDDFSAGQLLANYLSDKVAGQANIIALSGGRDSSAALDRNQGLYFAIQENARAELLQLVFSEWSAVNAGKQSVQLLTRHPTANVVWAVSDTLAIAAAHEVRSMKMPHKVVSGGVDWSKTGLKAVKDGWVNASIGGHFMEGVWALIMLYDYHQGIDFLDEGTRFYTQMHLADSSNIDRYYQAVFYDELKSFDYRLLSKALNPDVSSYDLNIKSVLEQFIRQKGR